MTSSPPAFHLDEQQWSPRAQIFGRRLFLILSAVALAYAFFAGLRTVQDFDLGWQMATGRWLVQHHQVPRVDVLSYTMPGQPWIYPVGSGLIFYLAYQLGGFALISWIGAAACVGTIAILLRRGSAATAAIAILAVPLIASRTTPRADMFSVVLFAAYLSLLWENYQTGGARLWLLPVLMVAWVNLHFGFASGLALVAAYLGAELLELLFGAERRRVALAKLRQAWPWLAGTALATLVNPWGWNIYRGLLIEQRAYEQGRLWINEWAAIPVNWTAVTRTLFIRDAGVTIYIMLAVAIIAGAFALLRGHWVAAILLLAATYPAVSAVRMGAVFACVVVIAAGPQWSEMLAACARRVQSTTLRRGTAAACAVLLVTLAGLRCADLVTGRHYRENSDQERFGAGLCSWFPVRAAEFIQRENPPGEILNTYAAGGYLAWSLGPQHRVYIDGRDTLYGPPHLARLSELMWGSPDSKSWQEETARYNINTVVLALTHYDGLPVSLLHTFCNSSMWSPVFLDERSAVFVRRTAQDQAFLERFPVNCASTPVPRDAVSSSRSDAFNTWTDSAMTLASLQRNQESQAAYQKALAIDPEAAFVHRYYGDLLFAMGKLDDSEQQYLAAIKLQPSADTWGALARSYMQRDRMHGAADAMEQEAKFAPRPYLVWQELGYLYLQLGEAQNALRVLNKAERNTPSGLRAADNGFFEFKVAQGQAAAWQALGDADKAAACQQKAADLQPNVAAPWRRLAKMYELAGKPADAERALARAAQLQSQPAK